ncbi:MAG: TIGR01906 family membrane protein [Firmicutes bacterium]|nr:TIGR01906 family membrane protein [Bacillota bacterium]
MKIVHILAGIFCVISLLVVILISSVDIAVYGDMRYFQKEYRKYDVIKNVNMEEKELLFVTEEMMSYLKGKRDNLNIEAVIDGEQQEFFNEKEIAHMKDVRVLFWGGQWLRRIGVIICIITVIFLLFQSKIEFLLKCLRNGLISFIVFMAILVGIITTNFTKYFVIFHKIFFSNNLWILNPETDRLINIVPEPFFIDTSIRIVVIFFSIILFVCIGCSVLLKIGIKKIGV